MQQLHSPNRSLAAVVAAVLLALAAAGCSKPADAGTAGAVPATPASVASQPRAPTKLGDLSAFYDIATDVATLVDMGDLAAAKTRVKVLEASWDAAEAGLKPRAASDWHLLDKAIDHALDALRADPPKQAECKMAAKELLATFNTLHGQI